MGLFRHGYIQYIPHISISIFAWVPSAVVRRLKPLVKSNKSDAAFGTLFPQLSFSRGWTHRNKFTSIIRHNVNTLLFTSIYLKTCNKHRSKSPSRNQQGRRLDAHPCTEIITVPLHFTETFPHSPDSKHVEILFPLSW